MPYHISLDKLSILVFLLYYYYLEYEHLGKEALIIIIEGIRLIQRDLSSMITALRYRSPLNEKRIGVLSFRNTTDETCAVSLDLLKLYIFKKNNLE